MEIIEGVPHQPIFSNYQYLVLPFSYVYHFMHAIKYVEQKLSRGSF
jgi:hypothetical protein